MAGLLGCPLPCARPHDSRLPQSKGCHPKGTALMLVLPGGLAGIFEVTKGAFLVKFECLLENKLPPVSVTESPDWGPVLRDFPGTVFILEHPEW